MLELFIVAGASPDNPTQKRKIFQDGGGVIGRDARADWVLHDPSRQISSQHARVIFSQGAYFLSDTSVNGIFTHEGASIRKGEYRPLKLGEVYVIGPYQFEVSQLRVGQDLASFKMAGLEHILSEPATESDELTPFVYAEKSQKIAPFIPENNTLKAFDFMPEPIDFYPNSSPQKKDLISAFRERFHLPADTLNSVSEAQFQQQILEVWLAHLKKKESEYV
ncbi:MAG: FHA domain-containing protein [Gammaproteobacteria bacterium]|nr:FHA domain-containing protein [Gammaproteobacteria bacterium]